MQRDGAAGALTNIADKMTFVLTETFWGQFLRGPGELHLWTHKAVLRDPDVRVSDVAKRYGVGRATI